MHKNKFLSIFALFGSLICISTRVYAETQSLTSKLPIIRDLHIPRVILDDGNVMEVVSENEPVIPSSEKGTQHLIRGVIKPIANVASGTVERIGKMLKFVKQTAGLDTNVTFANGAIDKFKRHLKLIYPGTRWCGDGDKARTEDDLGTFEKTDKCCRAHDKCFDFIPAGTDKYGLHNGGLFTRSHCTCDNDFYSCLKNSTELASKSIGVTYFTVLGPQCFREDDFVTGCTQYVRGKCIDYHRDPSKGRFTQWFDSPGF